MIKLKVFLHLSALCYMRNGKVAWIDLNWQVCVMTKNNYVDLGLLRSCLDL